MYSSDIDMNIIKQHRLRPWITKVDNSDKYRVMWTTMELHGTTVQLPHVTVDILPNKHSVISGSFMMYTASICT